MCDADDRLGAVIASIIRAGRTLAPNNLDGLLENIAVEVGAALMEEDARQKAAREAAVRRKPEGTIIPFTGPGTGRAQ